MEIEELLYCFEQLFKWMHGDVLCCLLVQRTCRCEAEDSAFDLPSRLDPQVCKAMFVRCGRVEILEFPGFMRC